MTIQTNVMPRKSSISIRVNELLMPLRGDYYWGLGICVLVSIAAAFQVLGESRDFGSYDLFFDDLRWASETVVDSTRFEAGFVWLSYFFTRLISSNYAVYGFLVFLALWVKLYALSYRGIALLPASIVGAYYIARFLPLHELTQLRAALAVSFVYLTFVFLERRRNPEALLAASIAMAFHVSVTFILPLLFIRTTSRVITIALLPSVFLFVSLFGGWLLDNLSTGIKTVELYQEIGHGGRANPLSLLVLLDACLIAFGLVFWDRATSTMKKVLNIQVIGVALFYGLLDYSVVAFRIYEVMSSLWVFYLYDAVRQDKIQAVAVGVYVFLAIVLYPILYLIFDPLFA